MKQPDTAALRERLANYTPEEELKQNKQELDGLLQEVNCQILELRNLLNEINTVKNSTAGIVTDFTNAVADLQKKDIGARVHPDTLKALNEVCTDFVVNVGKQLMAYRDNQLKLQKEHEERIARMQERNKGVWLSDRCLKFTLIFFLFYNIVQFIYILST